MHRYLDVLYCLTWSSQREKIGLRAWHFKPLLALVYAMKHCTNFLPRLVGCIMPCTRMLHMHLSTYFRYLGRTGVHVIACMVGPCLSAVIQIRPCVLGTCYLVSSSASIKPSPSVSGPVIRFGTSAVHFQSVCLGPCLTMFPPDEQNHSRISCDTDVVEGRVLTL